MSAENPSLFWFDTRRLRTFGRGSLDLIGVCFGMLLEYLYALGSVRRATVYKQRELKTPYIVLRDFVFHSVCTLYYCALLPNTVGLQFC